MREDLGCSTCLRPYWRRIFDAGNVFRLLHSIDNQTIKKMQMMKKLFVLFAVIFATSVTHATCFTDNILIPGVDEMQDYNPVAGGVFYGTIGGDHNCVLAMPSGSRAGYYTFLNTTRTTRFGSYSAKTYTLVINAYERKTGKYIGKFVGKISAIGYERCRYKGVFTNYKGGQVKFDLSER